MSKHDLQARPIYHHKRDSIEVHLTIVYAALADTLTAADPPPDGLRHALARILIHSGDGALN